MFRPYRIDHHTRTRSTDVRSWVSDGPSPTLDESPDAHSLRLDHKYLLAQKTNPARRLPGGVYRRLCGHIAPWRTKSWLRWKSSMTEPTPHHRALAILSAFARSSALSLENAFSIGLKLGAVGRQIEQARPCRLDRVTHAGGLVGRQAANSPAFARAIPRIALETPTPNRAAAWRADMPSPRSLQHPGPQAPRSVLLPSSTSLERQTLNQLTSHLSHHNRCIDRRTSSRCHESTSVSLPGALISVFSLFDPRAWILSQWLPRIT